MENEIENLHENMRDIKVAFVEHEKEHSEMMSRSLWFLLGSIGVIVSIGVWVGGISTELHNTSSSLKDKVSRDEFLGAIGNIDTKFKNLGDKQTEMSATLKEILYTVRQN